jgi:hypothetical protein
MGMFGPFETYYTAGTLCAINPEFFPEMYKKHTVIFKNRPYSLLQKTKYYAMLIKWLF